MGNTCLKIAQSGHGLAHRYSVDGRSGQWAPGLHGLWYSQDISGFLKTSYNIKIHAIAAYTTENGTINKIM